jgi:hypothetical protein
LKILITGNLGYVGPLVVERLRSSYPNASLFGFDIGYFAHTLTTVSRSPEAVLNAQYYGDVKPLLTYVQNTQYQTQTNWHSGMNFSTFQPPVGQHNQDYP